MRMRLTQIDLSESGHIRTQFSKPGKKPRKRMTALCFFFKRNFRAGKKTHCDVWFPDCRESTRDTLGKFCCYQLVTDLCRTRCDIVQAIVTHLSSSFLLRGPPG